MVSFRTYVIRAFQSIQRLVKTRLSALVSLDSQWSNETVDPALVEDATALETLLTIECGSRRKLANIAVLPNTEV